MRAATDLRREAVVDTALADVWGRLNKNASDMDSNKWTLAHLLGLRGEYQYQGRSRKRVLRETAEELAGMVEAKLLADELPLYEVGRAKTAVERYRALLVEREALLAEKKPLDAEWQEKQWSRFFLVTNHDGHIHSSMQCSTCRITTAFSWLPELSGLTEKDAVDAYGRVLCSVCFPSAPVEWTLGNEKPVDPDRCPGSGTHDHDSSGLRYYSPRAVCNHCHRSQSVTSTGKLRQHKKAAA